MRKRRQDDHKKLEEERERKRENIRKQVEQTKEAN